MDTFDAFFRAATATEEKPEGFDPHEYQRRLAQDGLKPVVRAPTGTGKTGVILAWLWRRLRADPEGTPRRLVYALPQRSLVEQEPAGPQAPIELGFDGVEECQDMLELIQGRRALGPLEVKAWGPQLPRAVLRCRRGLSPGRRAPANTRSGACSCRPSRLHEDDDRFLCQALREHRLKMPGDNMPVVHCWDSRSCPG